MSDDEYHKNRDPRLKKREPAPPGEFPPPPGTLDHRADHSDLYPPGEGPIRDRGSSSRKKSRSRSRSPDGRSRRRDYDSGSHRKSNRDENDEWKNKADAFLQNLGATPAGIAPQMGMATYPGYQGYPTMGYPYQGPPSGYGPPPQMMSSGAYSLGMDDSRSSSRNARNRTPPAEKRRRSPTPDQTRESKTVGGGITREQHEKLKAQQKQYHDAKEKLEAQLLKLKEQRETLKEDGAVHDDQIMKENAKLQKEVKSRIQYILDVLVKMDTALQQPILDEVKRKKSRSPSPKPTRTTRSPSPKETRRVQRRATSPDNDSSDDHSHRHRRRRPRRRSTPPSEKRRKSSSSEDEKRKRKKKNKRRKRDSSDDSSSSSSESTDDKEKTKKTIAKLMNIGDDSVFKMVADLQKSGNGKGKGKKSDDVVMGLLGKMSEAYMQAKADNKELVAKLEALEKDKSEMAAEIEKLKSSAAIKKSTEKVPELLLPAKAKKFENTKLIIKDDQEDDDDDPIMSEEVLKMEEIEKFEKSSQKQDRNRSVRAKMIEEELSRPRGYTKQKSRSRSRSDSRSNSRSRSRSKSRSHRRSRSKSYDDRDRQRERDRERRRQELEDRERERERNKKGSRDRDRRSNDINLDEWRPKTAENPLKINPTLASFKEKMKHKQDIEMALKQKDDDAKYAKKQSAWTSMSMINDNNKKKEMMPEPTKLEARPSVNIQWGSGSKLKGKTPEAREIGTKKSIQSFVGKMPKKKSMERDSVSPNRSSSKFGAQVNVPPPEVCTPSVAPPAPTYLPIRRALPKNPTPKNVDIKDMLAAAKAHMMARGELMPEPNPQKLDMEIPLPPLPAAQDRDPDAMKDTRPVQPPTPPPVAEKTELDFMLEMHNAPPGFSGGSGSHVVEVTQPPPPPVTQSKVDMTMYATYAAHWGPGFDPRAVAAAAANAAIPVPKPQIPPPSHRHEPAINPEETLAAVAEAVPMIEKAKEVIEKDMDMDAEELAMLGIDPSDFDGFGIQKNS